MIIVLPLRGQEILAYTMATASKMMGLSISTLKRLWCNRGVPPPYHNSKKSKNGYTFLTTHELNFIVNMLDHRAQEVAARQKFYTEDFLRELSQGMKDIHSYYDGSLATLPELAQRRIDEEDTY